jgi:hypothetical protein
MIVRQSDLRARTTWLIVMAGIERFDFRRGFNDSIMLQTGWG